MKHFSHLFLTILLTFHFCSSSAQIITTIAGNGTRGVSGDGGPATNASLLDYWTAYPDGFGNVYMADWYHPYYGRVRKVDASGIITTFAGNGTYGYSGDGGPATNANLQYPQAMAIDGSGNVYIWDYHNFHIRKVNTAGIITTFAGNGYGGDAGDGGPATAAQIAIPWGGICADAVGNVYFYSDPNYKIRKIDTNGIVNSIAGSGAMGFSGDGGPASDCTFGDQCPSICVDAYNNLYVCDRGNHRIRKIDGSTGIITTIAGNGATGSTGDGGPATAAQIGWPFTVSADLAGNVYFADGHHYVIRKIDAGGIITTISGNGTYGYSGDGGPATACTLTQTLGAFSDPGGNIYIGDGGTSHIRKITYPNSPVYFTAGLSQTLVVCQNSPADSINALLQVMDSDAHQLERWLLIGTVPHGTVSGSYTTASTAGVMTPHNFTYKPNPGYSGFDTFRIKVSDGSVLDTITIYVTVNPLPAAISGSTSIVTGGYSILFCTTSGGTWSSVSPSIATVGATTGVVSGVAPGSAVIKYTLPTGCNVTTTVNVFSYAGLMITTIAGNGTSGFSGDGGAATAAKLNNPWGVAVDASGNVFIADYTNNRIRKVNTSGVISTVAGTGSAGFSGDGGAATAAAINNPYDVAVDASGNLYIADNGNNRVRKVNTATGIITTVAGNGSGSFAGDGGPATAASFASPTCVEFDAAGNLYISADGPRVRKVNTSGIISTFAGNGIAGYSGDGGPATAAQLNNPVSLTSDPSGNIYIVDQLNNYIRKVSTSGIITTVGGTGAASYSGDGGSALSAAMNNPWGIVADYFANLFIGDKANNRLRKINTTSIMSTVAGNGTGAFSGDACAATASLLNNSAGVAVDGTGCVYIADLNNNRIRKVSFNHAPAFVGGHVQLSSVCQNSVDSLNTLLSITDIDRNQGITWSAVVGPVHGSLVASGMGTSNGGIVGTTGLYYAPVIGYTGNDSFKIMVADCAGGYDTTLVRITVTPPPSSIVGSATVCPLLTTPFTVSTGAGIWSCSNTAIANVGTSSGIVTGVSTGTAVISFSPGAGCYVTKVISVNPAPAAITGPSFVCQGQTMTLSDVSPGGSWSSGSSSATVVAGTGLVTGVTLGTVPITYSQGGCVAIKTISVNPVPGAITAGSLVCVGSPIAFSCAGGGVWSTGTPTIATVDSFTGVSMGLSSGTPLVTYTLSGGCAVTFTFTVEAVPAPISAPPTVCVGATATLTDPTPGGSWSTSFFTTSATINPATGVLTGSYVGIATISYTSSLGCSVRRDVTINPSPGPISGGDSVCIGSTMSLISGGLGGGVWTSSNPSAASVGSSTGVVSGIAASTSVVISYTEAGCSANQNFTVNPLPAAIVGPSTVCVGLTASYTDPSPGGLWTSGSIAVAGVGAASGSLSALSPGTTLITYKYSATGCSISKLVTVTSTPGAITGTPTVCVGATTTLSNSVSGGTWVSSATTVASVGTSGVVTGNAPGTATITYSVGSGCTTSVVVTVNPLPAAITGTPVVCAGSTITLSDVTPGGTWSSGTTSIATIGSTSGVLTGVAIGTSVIDYTNTATGCFISVVATVNPLPAAIGGPSAVCNGSTIVLTETTTGVAWSSSTPSIATVSSTGVVTPVSAGVATIVCTSAAGCVRTKSVTVDPLPSAITGPGSLCVSSTITLTGSGGGTWSTASTTASVGASTGAIVGISAGTAIITFTNSAGCFVTKTITVNPLPPAIGGPSALCAVTTLTLTSGSGGTWSSGTPSVATIGSTSGIVSGLVNGTTAISYTLPTGCATGTTVTVSSSPVAIAGAATVCAGATTTFSNSVAGGLWSSSNPSAATVGSLSGVVTGLTSGMTATITYSLGALCFVVKPVTVTTTPAAITGSLSLCAGTTTTVTDATAGGVWSSSTPATGTISTTGVISGLTSGTTTISYAIAGCTVTADVTVNPAPATISGPTTVCTGSSISLSNTVTGGTWSTTGTAATVGSATGIVTGMTAGTLSIIYLLGTCSVSHTVTVNAAGPISGASSICSGTTAVQTAPGSGSWSSSTLSVATINVSTGLISAISSGTSNITYTLSFGCISVKTVTVVSGPSSIGGSLSPCLGTTTTLTNAATGGIWTITPATIATIGSTSGIVTGIAPGTATVTYTLGSGCSINAIVTINATPAAITGPASVCEGSTISLSDATPGGTWTISAPSTATISTTGTVTGISSGSVLISYTLGSCSASKSIAVNSLPASFTTAGGGNYCTGGAGLSVVLSSSQTGIDYQLYNGTTPVGGAIPGTGSSLDFGLLIGVGVYTVNATNPSTLCSVSMSGSATINALPLPTAYGITGGGNYCAGTSGTHIGLAGSSIGVNYQLYLGAATSGAVVSGSGGPIDFGLRSIAGTYTAKAVNVSTTCSNDMSDSVIVAITATVVPSVTIVSSLGDTVCAGTTTTYSPTPVNGGVTPAYQWMVNGINTGTGTTYSYAPANGDAVSVTMTSNAACPLPATATTSLNMIVVNQLLPTVSVGASPGTTFTTGQSVTFTATVTNGGPAPTYQWQINAVNQSGATLPTFTSTTLNHGDVVSCIVTSSGQCGGQTGSGGITMVVGDYVGVKNINNFSDCSIIPNPNKGSFALTGNLNTREDENISIDITNVVGQTIFTSVCRTRTGKLNEQINLNQNTLNGIYLLKLTSTSGTVVFHVVVTQ